MPARPHIPGHGRRRTRPRLAAAVAVLTLAASLNVPLAVADDVSSAETIAEQDAAHAGDLPSPTAVQQALATAKSTGTKVTIDSLTTEYSETYATPDGHLAQTQHPEQQRMKQNGVWAALDATLVANPDGSYSPRAAPNGLTLSNGGGDQLATLSGPGGQLLSLTSPFPLPAPTASGSSLFYDVAPDTTLKVTATRFGGVSTVVILKTAAAAANPVLKKLHFGTTTSGVTVKSDAANNITAAAGDGTPLWHAPAPKMWDSTPPTTVALAQIQGRTAPRAAKAAPRSSQVPPRSSAAGSGAAPHAESTADGPGSGARVAVMPVQTDATGISLSTDQDILSKGTGPWYIDPGWIPDPRGVNLWNWVDSAHPIDNNDNRQGDADQDHPGIGTCGNDYPNGCSPWSTYHTYYRFDLSGLGGAVINNASLDLQEYVSADWSCGTTYGIDAYRTDGIANGTTWSNQPTWRDYQGTDNVGGSGKDPCHDNVPFSFNVTSAVSGQAGGSVTFGIKANDESNDFAFKRLTYQPSLTIQYDKYPNVPTGLHTGPATPTNLNPRQPDAESCGSGPASWYWWITSDSVQLQSTVSSPAWQQDSLNEWVNIWDNTMGGKQVTNGWSGQVTNGAVASYQLPAKSLQNGHVYGWEALANDGLVWSPKTPVCHFSVDTAAPVIKVPGHGLSDQVNTADKSQFPPSGNGQATTVHVGEKGYIPVTVDDPAPGAGLVSSGLARVRWSYDPNPPDNWWASPSLIDANGMAVTPRHWGTNVIYIQAEDSAGNVSQSVPYSFYVPWSPTPLAYGDVSGDGRPDVLAADAATGDLLDYGQALTFNAPAAVLAKGDTPNAPRLAAPASTAPDRKSWNNFHVSHRGTLFPQKAVDDLFVHRDGAHPGDTGDDGSQLYYYYNSMTTPGDLTAHRMTLNRPDCVTNCTDYGPLDSWAGVSQITPIGADTTDLKPTDTPTKHTGILAVEKGNLWYYPPSVGTAANQTPAQTFFGPPTELGVGGWDNYDLMVPGDTLNTLTPAKPTLWVRARADAGSVKAGDIYQYALAFGTSTDAQQNTYPTIKGITQNPTAPVATGITIQAWPVVGSSGDLTGDNVPDLWGQGAGTNQITTWAGSTIVTSRDAKGQPLATEVTGTSRSADQWLLDSTTKTNDASNANTANHGNPVHMNGATAWTSDAPPVPSLSGSAQFTGGVMATDRPAVSTGTSYSVSAWVKIDNKNTWQTFVSEAGANMGNFYLQYNKNLDAWAFLATASDKAGVPQYIAHSDPATLPVKPGTWTHLTGTYDLSYDSNNVATGTLTLYVNGQFAGSAGVSNPTANTWAATGPLTIGGVQTTSGAVNNQTTGHIADVRVYPYTLTKQQVATVYNNQ